MSMYILFTFLVIVCIWDIKTLEIPNIFLYIGIPLGLITKYIDGGFSTLTSSLLSMVIVFAITFGIWAIGEVFFGTSIIGGGDMKLLTIIGTFIGVQTTFIVLYWSILIAGFLFIFMIHPKEIFGLFRNIFHFFVYAIPKSHVVMKKIAFSVPITIATSYFIFI